MKMKEIDYVGEGPTDAAACRKLILSCGGIPAKNFTNIGGKKGKLALDSRIRGLNQGCAFLHTPCLALRDLDKDAACPAELRMALLSEPQRGMLLRICAPSLEAWLLADRDGFAKATGCRLASVPESPERIENGKQFIVNLSKSGDAPSLQRFFDAQRRKGFFEWQIIVNWNTRFIEEFWSPRRAGNKDTCRSLSKAIARLLEVTR
jgi:hypothetical protein